MIWSIDCLACLLPSNFRLLKDYTLGVYDELVVTLHPFGLGPLLFILLSVQSSLRIWLRLNIMELIGRVKANSDFFVNVILIINLSTAMLSLRNTFIFCGYSQIILNAFFFDLINFG